MTDRRLIAGIYLVLGQALPCLLGLVMSAHVLMEHGAPAGPAESAPPSDVAVASHHTHDSDHDHPLVSAPHQAATPLRLAGFTAPAVDVQAVNAAATTPVPTTDRIILPTIRGPCAALQHPTILRL